MKTIGLIGGTGWVSSLEYYRTINQEVGRRLGGLNAAKCILFSVNYGEIDAFNQREDEAGVLSLLLEAARKLRLAGADCLLLCANTLHQFAEEVERQGELPLIHIAAATAKEIKRKRLSSVGLLGTRPTMERDFYRSKLREENIEVILPEIEDRRFIHSTITKELLKGLLVTESKVRFLNIIEALYSKGAEGVVLGCTEIPLLVGQDDVPIPMFNTLLIHSMAAVDFSMTP
jgi:aspartate racemase